MSVRLSIRPHERRARTFEEESKRTGDRQQPACIVCVKSCSAAGTCECAISLSRSYSQYSAVMLRLRALLEFNSIHV